MVDLWSLLLVYRSFIIAQSLFVAGGALLLPNHGKQFLLYGAMSTNLWALNTNIPSIFLAGIFGS